MTRFRPAQTRPCFARLFACLLFIACCSFAQAQSQTGTPSNRTTDTDNRNTSETSGAIRLRQQAPQTQQPNGLDDRARDADGKLINKRDTRERTYVPGEFERFVQKQSPDLDIRRLGADLFQDEASAEGTDLSPVVPADYVVAPGDEVLLTLWGSVEADLRLVVDRGGRIAVPRVGAIQVAGVRNADLQEVLSKRIAQVFKGFQLSVSLGQLRGIRVFVTGFVVRPGAYTVSSLSSVVAALMQAGGPSAAGSFRVLTLRRGAKAVSTLDLYDLLLRGDRSADPVLQAGDVVHVGPVGPQVGIIGSINRPAVVEMKPGESVADALNMAGGFSAVADRSRLAVERLRDRQAQRVAVLELPRDATQPLGHGDVLRAFSAVDVLLPTQRQSKRVRIEGEVVRPGEYILPESSTVADAMRLAGGLTPNAYLYAAEFMRESVRRTQQENYDRALRDMETDLARASGAQRVTTADEAAGQQARNTATTRLFERLRALKPTGRVVLSMTPQAKDLPNLALEDGDRIYVPPTPTTVGVFGSVFNVGSYLFSQSRAIGDYLQLAGGPTRGADSKSVFVIRPNGSVISELQQGSSFFSRSSNLSKIPAEPGDTIFVPEEMDKTTFIQSAKDWAQILSQFGLGVAAIRSVTR
jgi:protein involved in polysaccharide export with SLBB domain